MYSLLRFHDYREDLSPMTDEHRVRINLGHTEDEYRESNHVPIEGKCLSTASILLIEPLCAMALSAK